MSVDKNIVINILSAKEDNKMLETGKGWVDHFRHFLSLMLEQLIAKKITLNIIDEDTDFQPEASDYVVCLLSPNFILSGSCLDRIEEYFNTFPSKEIQKRIYKVFKLPIDADMEPTRIKPLQDYHLYYQDMDSGRPEEIDNFFSIDAERFFWMKMIDMCYDLHEAIIFNSATKVEIADSLPQRKIIYLAETGQDLRIQRNIIKRELLRSGYIVYPDKMMPDNTIEANEYIRKCLKDASLSIHLIGTSYGEIPIGDTKSIVDIQNALAAEYSQKENSQLERLIWITPSLRNASEKQLSFIHALKRDADLSAGAEILQTSLEDFKNILRDEITDTSINKKLRKMKSDVDGQYDTPLLYFIYDKKDKEKALNCLEQMKDAQVEFIQPVFDLKLIETRNHHIDCLKQMDAAIVFQDKVNEQWVHMKLLDLLKAPGFGRNKAILGKALVISAKQKPADHLFRQYATEIIQADEKNAIKAFIDRVKSSFHEKKLART